MTYRAGIGPNLARAMGLKDAAAYPTLTCDSCGYRIEVKAGRGGGPPAWLANKKAPKGWKRLPEGPERPARHQCPRCQDRGEL